MKLRVYRSLLGSPFRHNNGITESAIAALKIQAHPPVHQQQPNDKPSSRRLESKLPGHTFDGVVLSLMQLEHILLHSHWNSNSSKHFGFICQLPLLLDSRATSSTSSDLWGDAIKKPFDKLSELLHQVDQTRKRSHLINGNDAQNCRPILDMVILAPIFKEYGCFQEYLSSVLPLASLFLESIPQSSIGINDRYNSHGKPLGQHVRGVSHYFGGKQDLDDLEEAADVFPPTRFVLNPNLRGADSEIKNPNEQQQQQHAPLSTSNPFGFSMGLEAVLYNTDALRVSPSTFHVDGKKPQGDGNQSHGLFGAGTFFGEVWSAQQLDGAVETCVICDDDDDHCTQDDEYHVATLAQDVQEAYSASKEWRTGAEERRREEMNEASKKRREENTAWMVGSYGAEVAESARLFGLVGWGEDNNRNDEEPPRLTTEEIQKRWQVLAFQSHPDTTDSATTKAMTFAEWRHHFLTLMKAAKQGED